MTSSTRHRYWKIALGISVGAAALFLHDLPQTRTSGGLNTRMETRSLVPERPGYAPEAMAIAEADLEFEDLTDAARNHPDLETRLDAISALGGVAYPGAGTALQALLDDPLAAVREEAVEALSVLGRPDSIAGLSYAMSDESGTVRRLALEGLSSIRSNEAINTLALALDERDPSLRELAIEELAEIGTDNALVVLQGFLSDHDAGAAEIAAEYLEDSLLD